MNEMSQFLIYQSEDGRTKIDVLLDTETLWLNQTQLAEPFGKARPDFFVTINLTTHGRACLESSE